MCVCFFKLFRCNSESSLLFESLFHASILAETIGFQLLQMASAGEYKSLAAQTVATHDLLLLTVPRSIVDWDLENKYEHKNVGRSLCPWFVSLMIVEVSRNA